MARMLLLKTFKRLGCVAWLSWVHALALAQAVPSAVVQTPQVRAELLAYAPQGVTKGQTLWLGLLLQHQHGWHTYWRNPGDSGLATQLQWRLPQRMQAGEVVWPTPQMIPVGNMVNHGFEGRVLLAVPVKVQGALSGPSVEVGLQADWLVCQQECIPQTGQFVLKLPLATSVLTHASAFEQLLSEQPTTLNPARQIASFEAGRLALRIQGLPPDAQGKALKAFAESPEVLASGLGLRGGGRWDQGVWHLSADPHAMRRSEPRELGVWLVDDSGSPSRAWRVTLNIQGDWPSQAQPIEQSTVPLPSTNTMPASPGVGVLGALLGAFLGGLLLNLMPCVLPVLAIKLLSLTKSALTPLQRRQVGSAYALGVWCSMLALAVLVMALRAAGTQLGWGFQLQSPGLVAGLTILFMLIALNLWGVLEWQGQGFGSLAAHVIKHPVADAFLSGVLAVLVAAPCTAPFMGASVGLAFTLPAWQGLLIFLSLGTGLALPFTLGAWLPGTAAWLPKPGPWMQLLRQALAFPMLLTVVWLLWIFAKQTSSEAASVWLAVLILLGGMVWSRNVAKPTGHWIFGGFVVGLCALLGLTQPMWQTQKTSVEIAAPDGQWQAWSPQRVAQALQQRQAVFIDFTAAWCVTCQVNKQTTLRDARVLKAFSDRHVLLLQADWTRQDPEIGQALTALGRSGVPVYALLAPGRPPQLLPELLTPDLVTQALSTLPP